MASNKSIRWGALVAFLLGWLITAVGFAAWAFILHQLYEVVVSALSAPGIRDGGSNNLGAGIGWAVLVGFVLLGALVAFCGALVAREFTSEPEDIRILRFAALLNGSLLGFALLAFFALSIFSQ